jgi:hypothetical protein
MLTHKQFQIGISLLAAIGFFSVAIPDMAQAACEAGSAPDGQWQQQTSAGIIVHVICSHAAYRRAHPISADQLQKEVQKQLDAKIKQEDAAKAAAQQQAALPPDNSSAPRLNDSGQLNRWQELVKQRNAKCESRSLQSATGMSKSDLDWCKDYWKGKAQKPSEVAVPHSQPENAAATNCNLPPKQLTDQQLKSCLAKTVADYAHEQRGRDVLRPQDEAPPITSP